MIHYFGFNLYGQQAAAWVATNKNYCHTRLELFVHDYLQSEHFLTIYTAVVSLYLTCMGVNNLDNLKIKTI